MKTTVINIFGGPGSGKSTTAAALFAAMKRDGKSVELVREFVKDWAWAGQHIGILDQPYIFGEQSRRESILYGRVRYIVTDSPLWLSAVYGNEFLNMRDAVRNFLNLADVKQMNFVLKRTKAYDPTGRYQNESEARQIDDKIVDVLRANQVPFSHVTVGDDRKVEFILSDLEASKEYA